VQRRVAILVAMLAGVVTMVVLIGVVVAIAPPVDHPVPRASSSAPSPAPPSAPPASTAPASPSVAPPSSNGASPGGSSVGSSAGIPSPSSTDPLAAQFHLGQPAPPLVVARLGGGTIDLSKLRGKPVWLDFMGTYCPASRTEFPLMAGFATRYASTGLVVVAVDVAESATTVAAYAKTLGATFPIGLDPNGTAQRAWGAIVLPLHYWIGQDGVIRAGAYGGLSAAEMAANLQQILPGVSVTP